ncbi:transposase [Bacillus pinisoli]|uniref:transposase n=1 Tax=Bacillus pinisoli TaxID=2901866 RepID=UPI001FF3CE1E|nr:transposase [Bacillus pinisoli]
MSRRPRVWFPGAIYHITSRGNRRSNIYNSPYDYEKYLSLIAETQVETPFHLHAYCLMSNHLHLLLETTHTPIPQIMWSIQTSYANYFNKKYELDGHVFQGRYGAKLIDSQKYFVDAGRYIHMNPVHAEIVEHPTQYHWSSYHYYVNGNPPPFLTTTKTISLFPGPKSYQFFVEKTPTLTN